MSKTNLGIILYWLVLVIPLLAYLLVNFYWWLFDGNVLDSEKMMAALCVVIGTGPVGVLITSENWEGRL